MLAAATLLLLLRQLLWRTRSLKSFFLSTILCPMALYLSSSPYPSERYAA
jgi:hypothetical protein